MAQTFKEYNAPATYSFTFPSYQSSDVKVRVDGDLKTAGTHYNITGYSTTGGGTVAFIDNSGSGGTNHTPSSGVVRIYRDTNVDTAKATFTAGSSVKAADLNNNNTQLLYRAQEEQIPNLIHSYYIDDDAIETSKIKADAVTGAKIADDQINSEHYVNGSIDTAHIADAQINADKLADNAVTTAKIQDNAVTLAKLAGGALPTDITITNANITNGTIGTDDLADGSVSTAKIAADAIDSTKIGDDAINSEHYAAGSIDLEHMSANSIDSDQYVDGSIDRVHLEADIIDGTKLADNAVNSEHYVDGSIDTEHLASGIVNNSKIADDAVQTSKIQDNAVTTGKIADAELKTLAGMQSTTASNLASGTALTATTAELNQLDGITLETSVTTNSDTRIPTSKAVNDLILSVTNALGGFVAIANETSFPTTHPDPSENAGTVVSISQLASGLAVNSSGVATITNGAGTGNTVTITGFPN